MRLSEAIRLGAMLAPQTYGHYQEPITGATCALGAASQAIGNPADAEDRILEAWPALDGKPTFVCPVRCSDGGSARNLMQAVIHLNDDHLWTREQIADWVQTIEPQDAPVEQHEAVAVVVG